MGHLNILKTVIGALALLGNGLVCVVIAKVPAMRTMTNTIIFNQAAIDFLTSVLVIVKSYVEPPLHQNEVLATIQCYLWNFPILLWIHFSASTFNLVLLTLERYVAIMYPFKYLVFFSKRKVALMLVAIWVLATGYESRMVHFKSIIKGECVGANVSTEANLANGIFSFHVGYLIPVVIMTFCYVHIATHLKKKLLNVYPGNQNNQDENSMGGSLVRARRNTLKTLFLVFISYTICWSPNQILFLAYSFGLPLNFDGPLYITTEMFVQINTCINPIIYAFKYKQFQKGVRVLLTPCCPRLKAKSREDAVPTIAKNVARESTA